MGVFKAILAQLVERIHGKDEVPGSIPGDGSKEQCDEEVSFGIERRKPASGGRAKAEPG